MRLLFLLLSYCIAYQCSCVFAALEITRCTSRSPLCSGAIETFIGFETQLPIGERRRLQFFYNQRYRVEDLWDAIDDANGDLFLEILDCECIYLDKTDENGQTSLHRALGAMNETMALRLIEAGADVNAPDAFLWTPLHYACRYLLVQAARLLLERGADVNAANAGLDRAVSFAVLGDSMPTLDLLISYGAEINFVEDAGATPLHIAAIYGAATIAQFLIDRGADIAAKDNRGQTPEDLICVCSALDERESIICPEGACTQRNIHILQTMFRNVTSIVLNPQLLNAVQADRSVGNRNSIAVFNLWISVVNGTKEEVEEILNCNCTEPDTGEQIPNCRCVELQAVTQTTTADWDEGQTALHLAVVRKHLAICRLLIENGARADVRNSNGDTPLHLATRNNSTDIVELFLAQEISADGQNNDGRTALHLASRNGFLHIVHLLVDYGASLTLNDEQGATPVEIVCICLLLDNCPEGSCRDGQNIVDLMTVLGEDDAEDRERVVQWFFPSNGAMTTVPEGNFSDEEDGVSSLGAFIGTLYACAIIFLIAFIVSSFVVRMKRAVQRRHTRNSQAAMGPSASSAFNGV